MRDDIHDIWITGRLVGGDCFNPKTKDFNGDPLVIKKGPNTGQPRVEFYVGVAVAKNSPEAIPLWTQAKQNGAMFFPVLFDQQGNCTNPNFAYKITDGDSTIPPLDKDGKPGTPPCKREGYPGHWVFNLSNGFAPKCYSHGAEEIITDPEMIKCGYYIRAFCKIKGNDTPSKPGIHLNISKIELLGYGKVIVQGLTGKQVFGDKPVVNLPAGCSATPIITTGQVETVTGIQGQVAPNTPGNAAPTGPGTTPASPNIVIKYQMPDGIFTLEQLTKAGWDENDLQKDYPRV